MLSFCNRNLNPLGKKTGDCVVRAIALASGKDYYDVYRELFELSVKCGYILNDKRVEEKYLKALGFVKHKQPRKPDGSKYRIAEIDKVCSGSVIVISCAHHLTAAVNGTLYDTWDCRGKCISNYYTIE